MTRKMPSNLSSEHGRSFSDRVVACCAVSDYDADVIKKHEKTRPDKVADRTEHMLAVGAQTGLIFLAFRNTDEIRDLIVETVADEPIYDFKCPQGVRQQVWRSTDTATWVSAFGELPAIYVADGHHRAESAKLARDRRRDANPGHTGDEEYNFVLAGMFPAGDLAIMPYNRAVKDLNGSTPEEFLNKVREYFMITDSEPTGPKCGRDLHVYGGRWYNLRPQ